MPSLLACLKAVSATFPDARKGRGGNIEISDFGVSAFSMFFMQSVSFLAFQRGLEKGQGRSNGQTLFGIGRIPSDNYIRDRLDEADPALLQPCFERMEWPTVCEEADMPDKATVFRWLLAECGCVTIEQQLAADEQQCRSYGFVAGTQGYAQCRMGLDTQRQQARNAAANAFDSLNAAAA